MSRPDEGLIHAWLDGELDAAEAARVEALVKGDAEWAAAAAEARGLVAASDRILRALDDVPAGVLPSRTYVAKPTGGRSADGRRAQRTMPWWALRAAAVIVVVAGTAVVLSRSPAPTDLNSSATLTDEPAVDSTPAPAPTAPTAAAASTAGSAPAPGAPVAAAPASQLAGARKDAPANVKAAEAKVTRNEAASRDQAVRPLQAPAPAGTTQLADERGLRQRAASPRTDSSARPPVADSLARKLGENVMRLSEVVTTGVAEAPRRSTVPFTVGQIATSADACYRESSPDGNGQLYRVRLVGDTAAVPIESQSPRPQSAAGAAGGAGGAGGGAANAGSARSAADEAAKTMPATMLRRHGDTLFVVAPVPTAPTAPGAARGAPRIALLVTCP